MSVVYFDSSALVKLVVDEPGSELAAALWDGADMAVSSRIAYPEVRAALGAAARSHRIADLPPARRAWERYWIMIDIIEVGKTLVSTAGDLAESAHLRAGDAIHLASAMAFDDPIVATWDIRLAAAATAQGLRVAPA